MIVNDYMKAELKCLISATVNWHSAVAKTALSDSELFQRVADKWDSLYYEITEGEMAKFIDTYDLAIFEMVNDGELNSLNIDTYEEIAYLSPQIALEVTHKSSIIIMLISYAYFRGKQR